jgi:Transposase DDE domain
MSDNLRQYRAIHDALQQWYPDRGNGRIAQHLTTLAALISGIVASRSSQLPAIATQVPDGNKAESRVKRYTRWVRNEAIDEALYFFPYAKTLLACLALERLVLVIAGSAVGRGCVALMVHVVYKGRALPIGWVVRQGKKGHCSEALHLELVEEVQDMIPLGAQVVFLGDGEFDGTELQKTLDELGWSYVCRTAHNTTAQLDGNSFRLDVMGACIKPGTVVALQNVRVTAAAYGPVTTICCWAKGYKEPIDLVSNLKSGHQACRYYEKRFRIETFFSDQKSRGFHLHKSHISSPDRLSRLLIACCLAYMWIVYLGTLCDQDTWSRVIHRTARCDLSLFQLGLRLLAHFLNEDLPIPVRFHIVLEVPKGVR